VIKDILARATLNDDSTSEPARIAPAMTPQAVLRSVKPPTTVDSSAVAKNVSQLVSDPDMMMRIMDDVGDELDDVAPQSAQDLRNTISRAVFFLASKSPKERPSSPGMPPLPAPRQDVLRFERYVKAVNDPLSIMDDAELGTLTPESVEAVKHVYPQVYNSIQADLADRVHNMPSIPYKRRMQLSALFGQDMTGTMSPSMVLQAQQAYMPAPTEQKSQQMPVSRAKAFNLSGRSQQETAAWREAQKGIGAWNRGNR